MAARATLRFDGEGILIFTAEAVLGGQVLGGDAHVADAERVGQHGNHRVDGLGIAHAGAGTQRRHQVGDPDITSTPPPIPYSHRRA